jgi:16S rRNA (guanine(966)-N(2))-methyltransferase RsmD
MTAPPAKRRPAAGRVRIIGGQWKRTPLPVVDAPGLRPTPDRVRETVFNWIAHAFGDLAGLSVLDLYAGTGALGFEAASRGAARAVLVENHPATAARLRETQTKLAAATVFIETGDALGFVRRSATAGERFDLVFLDPPFGQGCLDAALPAAASVCAAGGLIYVEAERALPEAVAAQVGFETFRSDNAGEVFYHLLQRKKKCDEETS